MCVRVYWLFDAPYRYGIINCLFDTHGAVEFMSAMNNEIRINKNDGGVTERVKSFPIKYILLHAKLSHTYYAIINVLPFFVCTRITYQTIVANSFDAVVLFWSNNRARNEIVIERLRSLSLVQVC